MICIRRSGFIFINYESPDFDSDVKRGQNLEAEAEAEAKASRPRPRPELRGRGQDYEVEVEAKNNYEKVPNID